MTLRDAIAGLAVVGLLGAGLALGWLGYRLSRLLNKLEDCLDDCLNEFDGGES